MAIDNIKIDGITIIPIYSLSVDGNNIYRLQLDANYFGANYTWATYNYVLSTIRRFITTISVSSYPTILPNNGTNVSTITALINDQYGDGAVFKPVFFTDTDPVGFITINPAYTDPVFATGQAVTYYKAGITPATVTIEGTVTQYD
jgi:hypothetical protein